MGNARIPRKAAEVDTVTGRAPDGRVLRVRAYRHVRAGAAEPMFYVVGYELAGDQVRVSTRRTRQMTGPGAEARMRAELAEARALLAEVTA
jgi:hypothetical protein